MRKIALINACTDLGVNVNGSKLGPQILTKNINTSNVTKYTILKEDEKDLSHFETSNTKKDSIDDFVKEFRTLLLQMHEAHFERKLNEKEEFSYYQKMQNLVLAVKALDTINEKRNLPSINKFNKELYKIVINAIEQNEFPLTVGGDHIVAIASSLASIKKHKNLGIVWFDSHADFNTYLTSVSGNLHGLPLAVSTHYEKDILSDFHDGPFYNPKNVVIVGGRDIDPWEWGNLIDSKVTVFSTENINEMGVKEVCKRAFEIASNGTDGVHVSFDLDLIDPKVAPRSFSSSRKWY